MKQIIREKDVIIRNNIEKMEELETHIADLEKALHDSYHETTLEEKKLRNKLNELESYADMPNILLNYEKLITDITASYEDMKEQRNIASTHLACIEYSFADLLEKYERLKTILVGFQNNQTTLLDYIEKYKEAMDMLQQKYDEFKTHALEKLCEANVQVLKKEKKYISEMAKVKSQVLQSKVKISELEKTLSVISSNAGAGDIFQDCIECKSPFFPLSTTF